MEQDKQLKQILLYGTEGASAGFTDGVMQKVNALAATRFEYRPLVSRTLKRLFVFTYAAVTGAILVLCLMSRLPGLFYFNRLQHLLPAGVNYGRSLVFLLLFWTVFMANLLMQKRKLLLRRGRLS